MTLARYLLKFVSYHRCEVSDMRDSVVQALGNINHHSLMDMLEEKAMNDFIREALDRKPERRRRRNRDPFRLQLVKVFELIAKNGTFSRSHGVIDENTGMFFFTLKHRNISRKIKAFELKT